MREYTVTLTIDTTAASPAAAAQDFAEYVATNRNYTVVVAEVQDDIVQDITQVEVGK